MTRKTVPFLEIADLSRDKLRFGENLVFQACATDGTITMLVEATRLGSDKRKITGFATMTESHILQLWAGLDKLVRDRGLNSQVETSEEYYRGVNERSRADQHRVTTLRRPTSLPTHTALPATTLVELSEDQKAVADEILDSSVEAFRSCPVSAIDNTSLKLLGYVFSFKMRKEVGESILSSLKKNASDDQQKVIDYVLEHGLMNKDAHETLGDKVRHAAVMVDVELTDLQIEEIYDNLLSR